jgi:hypothetical protein
VAGGTVTVAVSEGTVEEDGAVSVGADAGDGAGSVGADAEVGAAPSPAPQAPEPNSASPTTTAPIHPDRVERGGRTPGGYAGPRSARTRVAELLLKARRTASDNP